MLALENEVLVPEGFPDVTTLLRKHCDSVREVAITEFEKAEAGLSCLSILL